MRSTTYGHCRRLISFPRRQFLQDGRRARSWRRGQREDPSANRPTIEDGWIDQVYTPLVTLRVVVGQVLDAHHSCLAVVARLIAYRISRGQSLRSAETGA